MDAQKERIRQKICAAVAQIWRKETGSIVPLSIEGTICVTPWHGRTSAFHTSTQVPGAYPDPDEVEDVLNENPRKRQRLDSLANDGCLVDLGCAEEAALSSEVDEEAARSDVNKTPSARDDNNNQSGIIDAETDLEVSVKDEPCATDGSENGFNCDADSSDENFSEDGIEAAASAGPICPGTGYYTCGPEDVPADTGRENKVEKQSSSNVDSGVQDLSSAEGKTDESPKTSQVPDSMLVNSVENMCSESEADRATPTPLVVDLSRSSQQPTSQISHPATVQTAIRNMLSIKLSAGSNNKTSDDKSLGDPAPKSLLSVRNGITSELMFSKGISVSPILKTGKLVGISTPSTLNLPRHSTPISLSYSLNGRIVEKPLHSLLGVTAASPSSGVSAYIVSPKLDIPTTTISLPVVHIAKTLTDSVKVESTSEPSKNGSDQKTYSCKHCHKKFLFKSKYQEHMPVHTSDRPFQCTSCQRTYKYKYDLNVHLRTHQGIPTKSTVCPFCTKKFQTNKMLRLHINEDHRDQQEMKVNSLQPFDENSNHSSAVQDNSLDLQKAA